MATTIEQRDVNVKLPSQATDTTGTAEKKVKQSKKIDKVNEETKASSKKEEAKIASK